MPNNFTNLASQINYDYKNGSYRKLVAIEDPTFLGFTLLFDWFQSPLYRDKNGAVNYLASIGEENRVFKFQQFTDSLKELNMKLPYYFQSIEGLDTIWTDYYDPARFNNASEWIITIKTLESLDLRIYNIFSDYRECVFDMDNYREVIPSNLQKFNLDIYIKDIRTFRPTGMKFNYDKASNYDEINNIENQALTLTNKQFGDGSTKIEHSDETFIDIDAINKDYSGIIFHLEGCVFDIKSGGGFISGISNSGAESASNEIIIKTKSVSIKELIPWFNSSTVDVSRKDDTQDNKWDMKTIKSKITKSSLESAAREFAKKKKEEEITNAGNLIRSNIKKASGELSDLVNGLRAKYIDHNDFPYLNQSNDLGVANNDPRKFNKNAPIPEGFIPGEYLNLPKLNQSNKFSKESDPRIF